MNRRAPPAQELYAGGMVVNAALLTNQLIQPVSGHNSVSCCVGIYAVVGARCMSVNGYTEGNRFLVGARSQYEVKVASMKAKRDAIRRGKRSRNLVLVLPFAGQRPLIEV